jgi:hypothetical protein
MNKRPHLIEIEELVLTGNPGAAAIESAVLRALRARGGAGDIVEPNVDAWTGREVAHSVVQRVYGKEDS